MGIIGNVAVGPMHVTGINHSLGGVIQITYQ